MFALKPFAIKISSVPTRHVALTLNPDSDFMDSVWSPVLDDVSTDLFIYIYLYQTLYQYCDSHNAVMVLKIAAMETKHLLIGSLSHCNIQIAVWE